MKAIRRNCQPDVETSEGESIEPREEAKNVHRRHRRNSRSETRAGDRDLRSNRRHHNRSSRESIEHPRSLSGSDCSSQTENGSDDSDRKSSMLSLGTSHDSDDLAARQEELTFSDDERRSSPLSARLDMGGDPAAKLRWKTTREPSEIEDHYLDHYSPRCE